MLKNPYINALFVGAYIIIIVFIMNSFSSLAITSTIFMPMLMLSMLVLSVAIMGFLFVSKPLQIFMEGHKSEAIVFFGKTLGMFACFIVVLLLFSFLKSPKPVVPPTVASSSEVGIGERCGGNMMNAPVCGVGAHCAPVSGSRLPLGDVGGVCVKD